MSLLAAFPEDLKPASRLAASLDVPLHLIEMHRFPDGEGMPTVPPHAGEIVLYRSLDRPDPKLMPLLLAADAWRRAGASRLTLVAPYLCYLRQDSVFQAGQPLSRDVFGRLLGAAFDLVLTVDPHLHRTADISAIFGTDVRVLGAAPLLAQSIGPQGADWLVAGPDAESRPWAAAVAARLGAPLLVFEKDRLGDRQVILKGDLKDVRGRAVVLVDDICSSGVTLERAAALFAGAGARSVDIAVTHALFDRAAEVRLRGAGVRRIHFTDSCRGRPRAIPLAPLLAAALKKDFEPCPSI